MSRRNGMESKSRRRLERKFRDDLREAAVARRKDEWERLRPGPVVRSAFSAFLKSYDRVADKVPLDALFTFVAFPEDMDALRQRVDEARADGFMEYVALRLDDGGGNSMDAMLVITLSVCGEHNYRKVFDGCGVCSFHSVMDFFNSTFDFDESCYGREVAIAPEGEVAGGSVTVEAGDPYYSDFMKKAGVTRREFLMVEPWEFLFRRSADGSYALLTDVHKHNAEAEKINSLMSSREG